MKRVLLIAFHYPPVKGSSGLQRALSFSRYLRDFGWHPDVLTVKPMAYQRTGDDQMADIPADVRVTRAIALDAKRHLGVGGIYPARAAIPDRWASWRFDGVRRGLRLIRSVQPDAIWSTYPIATAHRIGRILARRSGLPWVADCRDSMSEEGYPADPRVFASVRRLEGEVARHADLVTFTAPGAIEMYAERYPDVPDSRWSLVENGFDEAAFEGLERYSDAGRTDRPLTLVHAGILYPQERDPLPFFRALARLRDAGLPGKRPLRVVLRATGHDERYRRALAELRIEDIVRLEPGIPYRDALQEMMQADGLLIFQASNCNHQIPAKAYEYLRSGRPVFALTDAEGDTAGLLQANGQDFVCALDDDVQIESHLREFLAGLVGGALRGADPDAAARYTRRAGAERLAALLTELCRK